MQCSRRRLLQRRLEFHVCTINKSPHTKKVWELIVCSSYLTVAYYLKNKPNHPLQSLYFFIFVIFSCTLTDTDTDTHTHTYIYIYIYTYIHIYVKQKRHNDNHQRKEHQRQPSQLCCRIHRLHICNVLDIT